MAVSSTGYNFLVIAVLTTVSNVFFDSMVGYALCSSNFQVAIFVFMRIFVDLMNPDEMLVIPGT